MSACVLLHRFERSLPSRGLDAAPRPRAVIGQRAALGGDRRAHGTAFDPQ